MTSQRVIVVGSGIGGLVAALELSDNGFEVVMCETASQPGGKVRQVNIGQSMLDAGPTVFTMRWVFDELFEKLGTSLTDHLQLSKVETLARHAWAEHECLDLFTDIQRSSDAIGSFAGRAEAARYVAFCKRARLIYETLETPFLKSSRPNPMSLAMRVSERGLPGLTRISPFSSMWTELGKYFRDPRLRQLFGRYATYCGSSPFLAPATLMLIAHVEQEGVWLLGSGMHSLARSLAAMTISRGATIRYNAEVTRVLIKGDQAVGVTLANGETLLGAAVVFNGDVAALHTGRLGLDAARAVASSDQTKRSLSAITWNLTSRTSNFPLLHHNVFFSGNSADEFRSLFKLGKLPADPTVYVCAQDRRADGSNAVSGQERLLCLVNAPARGDSGHPSGLLSDDEIHETQERMFFKLKQCGLALDHDSGQVVRTTPADFNQLFPASGGALYGRPSHGWMASFARPGARSALRRLYLAGGSTHPGPGVPMAALSGRQAAASVAYDLGAALRQGHT